MNEENIKLENVNFPEKEDEMEIDLLDLGYVLLGKLHYLVMWFLIGAVVVNLYAYLCIAPTYQATSSMYIVSASNDSVVNLTDLNIGTSLASDYVELIMSYQVVNRVIKEMDLDLNYEQLKEMIAIANPADTRILNITATTTEPQFSKDLANTMAEVAKEYLPEMMNTGELNIAQKAILPDQKVGPSYAKYTAIGAMLGLILCVGWFILGYLMDDTIHSTDDLEKYFGVVPLTTIPQNEQVYADDKAKSESKKRRSWKKKGKKTA